jgi:hypothetical protein
MSTPKVPSLGFPWYVDAAEGAVSAGFAVVAVFSVGGGVGDEPHAAKMKSDDKLKRQVVRVRFDAGLGVGRNFARGVVYGQKKRLAP